METLDDLRGEYQRTGIGELLYALLERIVWSTVREYPAAEYSPYHTWDRAACEDVLHDWIAERLWGRADLQVMLSSALTRPQVRAALTTSLRQHLTNKRRRSIASNLFRRVRSMMRDDNATFRAIGPAPLGAEQHWSLVQRGFPQRSTRSIGELVTLVCALTDDELEVVRYGPFSQKLSPILRDPKLRDFLVHMLRHAEGTLSLATIIDVMRLRFSLSTEEHIELDEALADSKRNPAETAVVKACARSVVSRLDSDGVVILAEYFKAEGKCEIAARSCGVSRSTAREAVYRAFGMICECSDSPEDADAIMKTIQALLIQHGD